MTDRRPWWARWDGVPTSLDWLFGPTWKSKLVVGLCWFCLAVLGVLVDGVAWWRIGAFALAAAWFFGAGVAYGRTEPATRQATAEGSPT